MCTTITSAPKPESALITWHRCRQYVFIFRIRKSNVLLDVNKRVMAGMVCWYVFTHGRRTRKLLEMKTVQSRICSYRDFDEAVQTNINPSDISPRDLIYMPAHINGSKKISKIQVNNAPSSNVSDLPTPFTRHDVVCSDFWSPWDVRTACHWNFNEKLSLGTLVALTSRHRW